MIATLVFSILAAMKAEPLDNILVGVMLFLVLAVLHYTASKYSVALERLNRSVSGSLGSMMVPRCFAAMHLVIGLVVLFGSVPLAVHFEMYSVILLGIAGFLVCGYTAFAALNPSTLGISIVSDDGPASHEAISVFTFVLKAKMRSVSAALGAGVFAGLLMLCCVCFHVATGDAEQIVAIQATARLAFGTLLISACLPMTVYCLFLFYFLVLDLWRSVLSLPGKLDAKT
jgi:hypothetical protein